MLTENLKKHMYGPNSISFATCTKQGIPTYGRALGTFPSEDGTSITVVFSESQKELHLANSIENSNISLQIGDMADLETYQYKGLISDIRKSTTSEYEIAKDIFLSGRETIIGFYGEDVANYFNRYIVPETWSITFKVEEIFNQTPGETAGLKII